MGMLIKDERDLEQAFKEGPYTSIGSYPVYFILKDGGCLCWKCVEVNKKNLEDNLQGGDPEWAPYGVEVNWEDPELYCFGCENRIESAYAEPE